MCHFFVKGMRLTALILFGRQIHVRVSEFCIVRVEILKRGSKKHETDDICRERWLIRVLERSIMSTKLVCTIRVDFCWPDALRGELSRTRKAFLHFLYCFRSNKRWELNPCTFSFSHFLPLYPVDLSVRNNRDFFFFVYDTDGLKMATFNRWGDEERLAVNGLEAAPVPARDGGLLAFRPFS